MPRQPAVYLLASHRNGTLYVGVTSDLVRRVWEHREHVVEGFTSRHDVARLVWYEPHEQMESAILREKRLKAWKRKWKLELIEARNPYGMTCGRRFPDKYKTLDSCFRRNDGKKP